MRLSDMIKAVEDKVLTIAKVVEVDVTSAIDAIAKNHAKKEEVKETVAEVKAE